jgi:uncharacterized protein YqhQ
MSSIGGQAVFEGVMMKNKETLSIAVRKPTGDISVYTEKSNSLVNRYNLSKVPILRGVLALFDALFIGVWALSYSANESGEEEETLSKKEMAFAVVTAVALAIGIFFILPTFLTRLVSGLLGSSVLLNVVEGLIRLTTFMVYIFSISRMKEIKRFFQYHGAEHKVIFCYENKEELTVKNCQKYSTLHPRCGTSFLLIVMVISIFVFSFFGWPGFMTRIILRITMLPVIAGISYEFIRLAGKSNNSIIKALSYPGLMLQKLTTQEPDDSQVEVAIDALKAVL